MNKKAIKILLIVLTALVIAIVLSGVLILNSIGPFAGTTKEYRTYKSFAKRNELGMSRQEIFDKLGCPDGRKDSDGYYHSIMFEDREGFEDGISADMSTEWYYDCWEYPDPANPYRLVIRFEAEGRSESIEFDYVPGG